MKAKFISLEARDNNKLSLKAITVDSLLQNVVRVFSGVRAVRIGTM